MSNAHLQLVEKLNKIVFDKGDVSLLLALDRVMDNETEEERMAALANVVRKINEQRTGGRG